MQFNPSYSNFEDYNARFLSIDTYYSGLSLQNLYSNYHSKVTKACHTSPLQLKISEVVKNFFLLLSTPVGYPILAFIARVGMGISSLTLFCNPQVRVELEGRELKAKIENLSKEGKKDWQDEAVKLIRQARYKKLSYEWARLRGVGVVTREKNNKINGSLSMVELQVTFPDFKQVKVLLSQALEIKAIYKKTHHVFIHAQSVKWMVFSSLVKEFIRVFNPEINTHHFKYLRAPCQTVSDGFLKSIWKSFSYYIPLLGSKKEEKEITVQDFLVTNKKIDDSNLKMSEKLLSADAYFYNYHTYESSLFFLINNSNCLESDIIFKLSNHVIKHFSPSIKNEKLNELCNKIKEIWNRSEATSGNYFVICLPKANSERMIYRAHPYGGVCRCHHLEKSSKILEDLQNDNAENVKCNINKNKTTMPQYRIYTPTLQPGQGTKIHLVSPLAKEVRREMKKELLEIAKQAYHIEKKYV